MLCENPEGWASHSSMRIPLRSYEQMLCFLKGFQCDVKIDDRACQLDVPVAT